jgi:hypothetical protein
MDVVKKSQAGGGVAVKIEHASYQSAKMFGRHFDDKDEVISHVTRASIDVLKATFKADVTTEEWLLIKALKPVSLGTPACVLVRSSFLAEVGCPVIGQGPVVSLCFAPSPCPTLYLLYYLDHLPSYACTFASFNHLLFML